MSMDNWMGSPSSPCGLKGPTGSGSTAPGLGLAEQRQTASRNSVELLRWDRRSRLVFGHQRIEAATYAARVCEEVHGSGDVVRQM